MAQATIDALKGKIKLRFANGQTQDAELQPESRSANRLDCSHSTRPAWTNHDTADPIDDIEEAKYLLQQHGAFPPDVSC